MIRSEVSDLEGTFLVVVAHAYDRDRELEILVHDDVKEVAHCAFVVADPLECPERVPEHSDFVSESAIDRAQSFCHDVFPHADLFDSIFSICDLVGL